MRYVYIWSALAALFLLCSCEALGGAWSYATSPEGLEAGGRAIEGAVKVSSGQIIEGIQDIYVYLSGLFVAASGGTAYVVRRKRAKARADGTSTATGDAQA